MSSLLSYAFRPFFLLGAGGSVVVMTFWVFALFGIGPVAGLGYPVLWHAHEMLFGFVAPVIAGFCLTAVAQWTGRAPLHGRPLVWLIAVWLVGRIAVLMSGSLPDSLVAVADMLFPLLLLAFFGREIFAAGNRRNFPLVGLVGLLALLNGGYHLGILQAHSGYARHALILAIHVVLLLITVVAGRIVPAFTGNWLRARGDDVMPVSSVPVERLVLVLTAISGVLITFAPGAAVTGSVVILTAALHIIRLSRWRGWATRQEPLLLVLHVAYGWLPAGYLLTAWSIFGQDYPSTVALHALTMGAIGGMILAMITRVSLGHTGRALHASRITVVAYVLMMLVVIIRIIGPWTGTWYMQSVEMSAAGWILIFILFIGAYWPVLSRPRVDRTTS